MTSPETVVALALAGTLDFDPVNGTLTNDRGEEVRLPEPVGEELPAAGFTPGENTFVAPPEDGSAVEVKVSPDSERLQLLEPFPAWDGKDFTDLPILVSAGQCPIHLDGRSAATAATENIRNLFLGAVSVPGVAAGGTSSTAQAVPGHRTTTTGR